MTTANYISAAICDSTKGAPGFGLQQFGRPGGGQGAQAELTPKTGTDRAHTALAAHHHPDAVSIAGLGVSIYLTITHFDKVALVCSDSGAINCEKVTTSPQSYVFGIPVAMLGLAFFVPMIVLCLPAAWRSRGQADPSGPAHPVGRRGGNDHLPDHRRAVHHQGHLPVVLLGAPDHVHPLRDHRDRYPRRVGTWLRPVEPARTREPS